MAVNLEFRKTLLQLAAMGLIVIIICILCRRTIGNHLEISIPLKNEQLGIEDLDICCEDTVQLSSREIRDGRLILDLEPVSTGAGSLKIRTSEGTVLREEHFEVSGNMTVRENETGNFTGDGIIAGTLSVFFLAAAFLMLRFYFRTTGSPAFTPTTPSSLSEWRHFQA